MDQQRQNRRVQRGIIRAMAEQAVARRIGAVQMENGD